MQKLNTKNPFQQGKDKSVPQEVIFTCNCKTLREAKDLKYEINFRVKALGYEKQDFKCEIIKKEED